MKLRARVVPVDALAPRDVDAMWALFERYYDCVDRSRFEADLSQKDHVIVLRAADARLCGFSTLKRLSVTQDGTTHHAVFSGDTVVEQAYWGDRSLGVAFLRYLAWARLRHPLSPLWWILITKGYKTYLLMAHNFAEFWPRHDQPTPPDRRTLIDRLATHLFPEAWRADLGVVRFATPMGQLKAGVATIPAGLRERNPHVAFFDRHNPGWPHGDELFCVARMAWTMPLTYALKAWRKAGTP